MTDNEWHSLCLWCEAFIHGPCSLVCVQVVSRTVWRTVWIRSIWWQPLSGRLWRPPPCTLNSTELQPIGDDTSVPTAIRCPTVCQHVVWESKTDRLSLSQVPCRADWCSSGRAAWSRGRSGGNCGWISAPGPRHCPGLTPASYPIAWTTLQGRGGQRHPFRPIASQHIPSLPWLMPFHLTQGYRHPLLSMWPWVTPVQQNTYTNPGVKPSTPKRTPHFHSLYPLLITLAESNNFSQGFNNWVDTHYL